MALYAGIVTQTTGQVIFAVIHEMFLQHFEKLIVMNQ